MQRPNVGMGIILVKNNQILLGRRADSYIQGNTEIQGHGTWTLPGGKLDFGEKLIDGICRETKEETGIVLNKKQVKLISVTDDITDTAHYVTTGFYCNAVEQEPKAMEPEKIPEWKWFSLDNLPKIIFPPSQQLIKNFFDRTLYRK